MSVHPTRQALRTFAIVTVVTLFIWVYAESESLRRESVSVSIRVGAPSDSAKVVWYEPNNETSTDIEVTLQGSTAALDAMRSKITEPIELTLGELGVPTAAGTHELILRDLVRQLPRVARAGVTIDRVQPPSLTVHIEALVPVQVAVVPQLPDGLVASASASPATVTIHMPEHLIQALGDEPQILAQLTDVRAPTNVGQTTIPGVRLLVPDVLTHEIAQGFARIEPDVVDLVITLRAKTVTETIGQVPIHLALPNDALDEYVVAFVGANYLTNVRVVGSPQAIDDLKQSAESISLFAYVPLLYDDLRVGEIDMPIVFFHVDGVQIETDTTTVRLRVSKREVDQPGAGAAPDDGAPATEPNDPP